MTNQPTYVQTSDGAYIDITGMSREDARRALLNYENRAQQNPPPNFQAQQASPTPQPQQEPEGRFYRNEGGQRMMRTSTFEEEQARFREGTGQALGFLPERITDEIGDYRARLNQLGRVVGNAAGNAARGSATLAEDIGFNPLDPIGSAVEGIERGINVFRPEGQQVEFVSPQEFLAREIPVPETHGMGERISSAVLQFGVPGAAGARVATSVAGKLPRISQRASNIIAGLGGATLSDAVVANPAGQEDLALTSRDGESNLETRLRVGGEGAAIGGGATAALSGLGRGVSAVTGSFKDATLSRGALGRRGLAGIFTLDRSRNAKMTAEDIAAMDEVMAVMRANLENLRTSVSNPSELDQVPVGAIVDTTEGMSQRARVFVDRLRAAGNDVSATDLMLSARTALDDAMAEGAGRALRPDELADASPDAANQAARDRAARAAADAQAEAGRVVGAAEQGVQSAAGRVADVGEGIMAPAASRSQQEASQAFSEQLVGSGSGVRDLSEQGAMGAVRQRQRDLYGAADVSEFEILRPEFVQIRSTIRSMFPNVKKGAPLTAEQRRLREFEDAVRSAGPRGEGERLVRRLRSIADRPPGQADAATVGEIARLRPLVSSVSATLPSSQAEQLTNGFKKIFESAIETAKPGAPRLAEQMQGAVRFTEETVSRIGESGTPQARLLERLRAGQQINSDSVLNEFLGSMGPSGSGLKGAQFADNLNDMQLLIGEFGGNAAVARQAAQDYARSAMYRAAVGSGEEAAFNSRAANRFVRNNRQVLESLGVYDELSNAARRGGEASRSMQRASQMLTQAQREARRLEGFAENLRVGREAQFDATQRILANEGGIEGVLRSSSSDIERIGKAMAEEGPEALAGFRAAIADHLSDTIFSGAARSGDEGSNLINARQLDRLISGNYGDRLARLYRAAGYSEEATSQLRTYLRALRRQSRASKTRLDIDQAGRMKEGAREGYVILASVYGIVQARGITSILSRIQRGVLWGGDDLQTVLKAEMSRILSNPEEMARAAEAMRSAGPARERQMAIFEARITNNLLNRNQDRPEQREPAQ
jgi:hypothetical protein